MSLPSTNNGEPPALDARDGGGGFIPRFLAWQAGHPILAIVLVSLLSVVINCYPVIFCGKSYVSPTASRGTLVYNWWPLLPGRENAPPSGPDTVHGVHGSDSVATMIWGVPAGFIASRSLLDHGTLPLWNRYGHTGDTFIGQAISMLGDPLQLIVIFGHGCAVAWDLKFLASKFLFCVGFGWLILRLTKNGTLSLIFAALAAWCGAYFYINNHPVFFVLGYAPWILLAALQWLDLSAPHRYRWALLWLLANFSCFNAGHVETAVVLIGGLNLAAVLSALANHRTLAGAVTVLGRIGLVTLLFLGLTAPVWMSFLGALSGAYTAHMDVKVQQLPATLIAGVFDDFFYHLLRRDESFLAVAPGTSLLILVGGCFSAWRWRQLRADPFFWINSAAILLWAACIFGLVPASLLARVPFFNRVGHLDIDFSYALVLHLTIQAAYGYSCLAKAGESRRLGADFIFIIVVLAALVTLYSFGPGIHQPVPWDYFLGAVVGAVGAPFLFLYMKGRQQHLTAVAWLGILILGFLPNFRFGLYHTGNDKLLMIPDDRAVLNAPSPAIDRIRAGDPLPSRVVGLMFCFDGDYGAVYQLEDIRSCAPVSDAEFIYLIRHFPGIEFIGDWTIEITDPVAAQPLLNLFNVKYLLASPGIKIPADFPFPVIDRSDFGVLKNPSAWPRAFFASQIVPVASSDEFIQRLQKYPRQPFIALTPAEIETQPGLRSLETSNPPVLTTGTNYVLLPNSTAFDIHAPAAGVVCLAEGQGRDFTATANGGIKPVLTVNRVFKGIYLDQPGDYHVQFTYRPRHWDLALACFWFSLAGMIIMTGVGILRGNRHHAAKS